MLIVFSIRSMSTLTRGLARSPEAAVFAVSTKVEL